MDYWIILEQVEMLHFTTYIYSKSLAQFLIMMDCFLGLSKEVQAITKSAMPFWHGEITSGSVVVTIYEIMRLTDKTSRSKISHNSCRTFTYFNARIHQYPL